MTTLFGLKHCSTCQKARRWLDERKIPNQFVDYRAHPVNGETLLEWAGALGWPKLVNRASMTWRKLDPERQSPVADAEWLDLVNEFPALLRRPVVVVGEVVSTGFSPARFQELFSTP